MNNPCSHRLVLFFVDEEVDTNDGYSICALLLIALSLVLLAITFPFSLIFSLKVRVSRHGLV